MTSLKIRTRLLLALAIPLLALGGLGVRYLTTIDEVKVDGSLYDQVTGPRAVLADVALLAENQSRALIDAQQIITETTESRIGGLVADLAVRQEYYLEAADAWSTGRIGEQPELVELLEEAYDPSVEFYRVIDEELLPAVEAGDDEAAVSAVAAVGRAYAFQRAAADRVLDAAETAAAEHEAAAASYLDDRLLRDQAVAAGLVALAVLLGVLTIRSITRPLRRLEHDLPAIADELRNMDLAAERPEVGQLDVHSEDELAQATKAFNSVVATSVDLAVEQVRVRQNLTETLQHLGRRNQNLLRRMMAIINELEHDERDAEALQELFRLDHIATRMRRNAESLLVLAGSEQARRWTEPVPVIDVVRSAASEIEDYDRVDLTNLEPVVVQGSSAADIAHLLAELLENATLYSPPQSRVVVGGRRVPEGYQVAVLDHGLGLDDESLERANARIRDAAATPEALTDSKLLGLNVVGRLAERHGTRVELAPNPAGGMVAIVTLPRAIVARPPTSAGVVPGPAGPVPAMAAPQPPPTEDPGPVTTPVPAAIGPSAGPTNGTAPTPTNAAANGHGPGLTGVAAAPPAAAAPITTGPAATEASAPDGPAPGLRRRVRSADETGAPAGEVVHGPARSAEVVRDTWNRLAMGVRQARIENSTNGQEGTTP